MPDPSKLKVGDKVRFISMPEEWSSPDYYVHRDSRRFVKCMLERRFPSRIYKIDESGTGWIAARLNINGKIHYHTWGIMEKTGWIKVKKRPTSL